MGEDHTTQTPLEDLTEKSMAAFLLFDEEFHRECVQMLKKAKFSGFKHFAQAKRSILRAEKFVMMEPSEFEAATKELYVEQA